MKSYRLIDGKRESISIFCYDIYKEDIFAIDGINRIKVNYRSEITNCNFLQDSSKYVSGVLKITKYDMQQSIIAGEFECKLFDKKSGCDTIRITDGRFDYHL